MSKMKETTNGNLNGNSPNGKPKLDKPISKMTVKELAENFEANELMRMAFAIREKNRKKGIVIE
ncbi:hypothetical protein BH18ACI1_BH18ACI1_17540 [soil metagenome]